MVFKMADRLNPYALTTLPNWRSRLANMVIPIEKLKKWSIGVDQRQLDFFLNIKSWTIGYFYHFFMVFEITDIVKTV